MKIRTTRRGARAFTLIEILIVVAILGILAAIVVPSFVSVDDEARAVAIKSQLRLVRMQIQLYRARHQATNPASLADLVADGYLPRVPEHPGSDTYQYDPLTGRYDTTLDPSW